MTSYESLEAFLMGLADSGRLKYKKDVPLSAHCTIGIGGRADYAVYPSDIETLTAVCAELERLEIYNEVFGRCSNVLFDDAGFRGAVVFTSGIIGTETDGEMIKAGCGVPLSALAVTAQRLGLSGMEFAYGIPGSLGGAVYMNAGAYGGEMKDVVVKTYYFDPKSGKIGEMSGDENRFSYRSSAYTDTDLVILGADIRLGSGDPAQIKAKMDGFMRSRAEKQPLEYPSAGSVFKRCPGFYTAQLIERAGLKGRTVGGAQVSEKHAGFIINRGGATAEDFRRLVKTVKDELYRKNGLHIQCEIRYIPPFPGAEKEI